MLIRDIAVSTHLHHIAQEAVNNAIKHGGCEAHCNRLRRRMVLGMFISWMMAPEFRMIGQNSRGMGMHIMGTVRR